MMIIIAIVAFLVASAISAGILWVIIGEFDHRLPYLPLYGLIAVSSLVSLIPMIGWLVGTVLLYFVLMRWSGMSFVKTLILVTVAGILNNGLWRLISIGIEKST